MFVIAALYLGLLSPNEQSRQEEALDKITSCQRELIACATGNCRPKNVTKVCPVDALRPRELRILQTELHSATNKFAGLPESSKALCVEEFNLYFSAALDQLNQNGHVLNYHLKNPRQDLRGVGLEAFYRAEVETKLTGIVARAQHIDGARESKFNNCPLTPFTAATLFRAQNLAFARANSSIETIKSGELNRQILHATWFIFHHADLWQKAQKEAADVFDDLQVRGEFPAAPAHNLRGRVEAHTPLYEEDRLARDWP